MLRFSVSGGLLLTFVLPTKAFPQTTEPKPAAAKDERLSLETPEGTLRLFTLGVLLGNEQLVKATIVPVSKEDFAYLVQGTKNLRTPPKQLKEDCARMKVQALQPGDVVTLPGGEKVTVTKEEVTEKRMVLVLDSSPVPTRLYKAKGYWWVDASPVVAGRKAAAEANEKNAKVQQAEVKKLEGTWKITSIQAGKKPIPPQGGVPVKAVIEDGRVSFFVDGKEAPTFRDFKIQVIANQKPKALNLVRGDNESLPCIYELKGDQLKLAMPLIPKERKPDERLARPKSFDVKDKPFLVMTASRQKD